ncbi:PucR family transcriptional regulator [Pseudonocardiaceae bacterium YIM PH 21723]|nr:PucR family transcriptional regulator [Pseudonocardiaceae bacterium YIM PH 21723]
MRDEPWSKSFAEIVDRRDRIVDGVVGRIREDMPGYARLAPGEFQRSLPKALDMTFAALLEDRLLNAAELEAMREIGALRARTGIPLEELLRSVRVINRMVLTEVTDIGKAHNVEANAMLELHGFIFDVIDQAVLAVTAGHQQVELERSRSDERRREDFARAVLLGASDLMDLRVVAQGFGLDPDVDYVPFRTRDPVAARRLAAPGGAAFTVALDGDVAGFATALVAEPEVAVGRGPAQRLDRLATAFGEATRALHTAIAFGRTGLLGLDELGLLPAVLADTETGDRLVRRYLEPVDGVLVETLRGFLRHGQHIEHTASALFVHPNTIRYRIKRYQELTGVDLSTPDAVLELWWALRRAELRT